MTPTWASPCGRVQLYLGDCRRVLACGEIKADAVVTDPPYGIDWKAQEPRRGMGERLLATPYAGQGIEGDAEPFDPAHLLALGVPTILWGAHHFARRLPETGSWLVWDKKVRPEFYGRTDFSDADLAWCSEGSRVLIYRHLWNGVIRQGEEWAGAQPRLHPNQKPVALMSWCLSLLKLPRDKTVLDPYMGSAPLALACLRGGQRYVGIELDPHYFWDICVPRVQAELEGRPFDPRPTDQDAPLFDQHAR